MKKLLLLPLSLVLLSSCADSKDTEPTPQVQELAYTADFRVGNWGESKAAVLSRDIAPASDEGNIVIMPFNRRNTYDVYEFRNGVLVGGLVKGHSRDAVYNELVNVYGTPVEQTNTYTVWHTERSKITFYEDSPSVYFQPR